MYYVQYVYIILEFLHNVYVTSLQESAKFLKMRSIVHIDIQCLDGSNAHKDVVENTKVTWNSFGPFCTVR